jgi:hypothetical protein
MVAQFEANPIRIRTSEGIAVAGQLKGKIFTGEHLAGYVGA